jgi:hypothetical protein
MSMGLPGDNSPYCFSPISSKADDEDSMSDVISQLELNDEEFAAQEQAHT